MISPWEHPRAQLTKHTPVYCNICLNTQITNIRSDTQTILVDCIDVMCTMLKLISKQRFQMCGNKWLAHIYPHRCTVQPKITDLETGVKMSFDVNSANVFFCDLALYLLYYIILYLMITAVRDIVTKSFSTQTTCITSLIKKKCI